MNKNLLSIGELSKLSNVNIKCLRYYDQLGILPPAYVAPSGYRYYSPAQLVLVDAIQLCIDLNIPLKQFHDYYHAENGQLHYDKLFEDGTCRVEAMYQQIKSRLARLGQMQGETKRCETVLQTQDVVCCRIPDTNLWLGPYQQYSSKAEQLMYFYPQLHDMEKCGVRAGYDTGRLLVSRNGKETMYIYLTVDIIGNSEAFPEPIIRIPPAEYYCKAVDAEAIVRHNDIFPAFAGKDKIIIEAELFTPEYDATSPKYELRCLPIISENYFPVPV